MIRSQVEYKKDYGFLFLVSKQWAVEAGRPIENESEYEKPPGTY
jgi:hypothetical protein